MKVYKLLLSFILISISTSAATSDSSSFFVCKSTFALCTTAKCTPVTGTKDTVNCRCIIKKSFSASGQPCQSIKNIKNSTQIYSRYYPVHGYKICTNNRPWAWCLDKPCTIDKNDKAMANCLCTQVKNMGKFVIVTDNDNKNSCDNGIISSATVKQITQITNFLKNQKSLKPFVINVSE
jgi:hypothetical protein